MNWVETPAVTQVGWYWWCSEEWLLIEDQPVIVEVVARGTELGIFTHTMEFIPLSGMLPGDYWYGPLTSPGRPPQLAGLT